MGTTRSAYVGVFLTIPNKKVTVDVPTYFDKNNKPVSTPFCPNTGEQHRVELKNKTQNQSPSTWLKEYKTITPEEKLLLDGENFFMPAYHGNDEGATFIIEDDKYKFANEDYEINVDIGCIDIETLMSQFKEEYKQYLDLFKREYGSVSVHFGLVKYAH